MTAPSMGVAAFSSIRGEAPGLKGLAGRIGLQVAGAPVGVLLIEKSGEVGIVPPDAATTQLLTDSEETLENLLSGEMNPIVAYLQGLLRVQGEDSVLVLRVLLGLQAGSPWRNPVSRG